ncbi:pre-rRNA-processing protein TSR1 protein [Trifolium repens]|nr:pre-rRNA-processing protein TSR1 protein [Trifolium repens]KAK2404628.1 pre-rRNA-processing protein TSR1 protein [Trifolium repens]
MVVRRTRVQANKSHKSRFSTKSSRNIQKTSSLKGGITIPITKTTKGKGARAARIQRNKTIRQQQGAAAARLQQKRESTPPRVIVLFALCASVDLESLADDLFALLSKHSSSTVLPGPLTPTIDSSEYRARISVLKAPHGDLLSCMEMLKVADLLVFVASARSLCQETGSHYIDSFGDQCLSVFRSLGLPSTVLFVRDLPTDLKQRNELKKICSSSLASEFPEDCRCYPADTQDDLHKFLWLFKEQRLKIPHWRTHRSYLMAHKVDAVCDDISSDKCTLLLTGYVRARNLSVNQQVHVSGAGDFRLCKIEVLEDPFLSNSRKNQDLMDSTETHDVEVIHSLVPDPQNQEDVVAEKDGEQTRPPEVDTSTADEDQQQKKTRKLKLPPGTSEYQAEWYFHDFIEEKSDGVEASLSIGDSEEETDIVSMMEVDNMTRENIQDELKAIKEDNAADEEFPDEVDTPLDVPARTRFAKYRHLKSFRNSSWDPNESLPKDYPRNFNYHNFKKTQKHVLAKALELDQENREDCVPVGSFTRLHIMDVPKAVASKLCMLAKTNPVTASGLLEHECEVSILHFSVKKHDTYHAPIKSKEELIFHVGFRQFVGRPIFSSEFINTDKSKMERFLHAGRFSVASVCAKISFPPLPTIILKRAGEDATPAVAALGSLKTVDRDRIILKRVILTGYPQRVSKRKSYVKHMFYNPDDVKFFKPVELYTKRGLRGRIKEPVGTHGAMKCLLNGVLEQRDTICLNLYKRVYPK